MWKLFSNRAVRLIAEAKIETAINEGEFDHLPGLGKPFEFDDTQYDPNWWIRQKIERETMKNLFSPTPTVGIKFERNQTSDQSS